MDNLVVAISLALANCQRAVIHTRDVTATAAALVDLLDLAVTTVDLETIELHEFHQLILETTKNGNLYPVILLKNIQYCSDAAQRQLVKFFDQLDHYDTNQSRLHDQPTIVGGTQIETPQFYTFLALIEVSEHSQPSLYKNLKERFWFSHYHDYKSCQPSQKGNFWQDVARLHETIGEVYQSHEIAGYINSLVVEIRNHRLIPFSPIQARLHTNVIDKVSLLAKSIVAWKSPVDALYVTPEQCQIAMRKIGYWLVEWQTNGLFDFTKQDDEIENRRKLVMTMLAGEWYGSEWEYVKKYLEDSQKKFDPTSNTGFLNSIVEESIRRVRPPV